MLKFIKEKQQLTIILATVLLVAAFVLLRYLPMRKKLQAVRQAKVEQYSIIGRASAQQIKLPRLREELERLQKQVENFDENVPVQTELGQFLGKIAQLMDEHQLSEQVIEPDDQIKVKNLSCIPVTMKCKGRLEQIWAFHESLQQLNRAIRIEQFKLTNDRDFGGDVVMETKAVIYYRDQGEQGNMQG